MQNRQLTMDKPATRGSVIGQLSVVGSSCYMELPPPNRYRREHGNAKPTTEHGKPGQSGRSLSGCRLWFSIFHCSAHSFHTRDRPRTTIQPSTAPARTSEGKWEPRTTREQPTTAARARNPPVQRGYQSDSRVASANAVVAWPDGNEASSYGAGKQGKPDRNAPAPSVPGRARQVRFFTTWSRMPATATASPPRTARRGNSAGPATIRPGRWPAGCRHPPVLTQPGRPLHHHTSHGTCRAESVAAGPGRPGSGQARAADRSRGRSAIGSASHPVSMSHPVRSCAP